MSYQPVKTPIRKAKKLLDERRSLCLMGTGYKSCKSCHAQPEDCWESEASQLLAKALEELESRVITIKKATRK